MLLSKASKLRIIFSILVNLTNLRLLGKICSTAFFCLFNKFRLNYFSIKGENHFSINIVLVIKEDYNNV